MIWFIQDYNEYEIRFSNLIQDYYVPKFQPPSLIVDEPHLIIHWNDRQKGGGGDQRELVIDYLDVADGYGGYADNPSSAADLKLMIEEMIVSAFEPPFEYDRNAEDFFNEEEDLGNAFADADKLIINDFFLALKAFGIYYKTDFCHIWYNNSLLNIVNPVDSDAAHRAELIGSPTYDNNGVTTNGATNYVNLNYNPNAAAADPNDTARAFYFRSVGTGSNFGALDGGFQGSFLSIDQGGMFWGLSSFYETGVTPSPKTGFWLINRTASNAADLRLNDVSVDTDTTASAGNINADEYMGCRNIAGANNFSADNFCFTWGGRSLTPTEATNFNTAVVTLQTAWGRNV